MIIITKVTTKTQRVKDELENGKFSKWKYTITITQINPTK